MKTFYFKNKKILDIVLMLIFGVGFFSIANICYADPIDKAVTFVFGWTAVAISKVCGMVLLSVIDAIISISKYNDFINNPQIIEAWVIIRDLCNMFFVLILLVIAFATILRIESYNVKKALPKLLIMAVLINFSRIIVGLFIDFSQVIMLTFVNAFADGGGNFVSLLKVDQFLKIAIKTGNWFSDDSVNLWNTVAGIMIAVLFIIVATITLVAILVIFIMRVIMLWIYIVLSPLAFLLSAFPGGQKYASQYWGDLTKYLINGPVLAFFIWLALITLDKLKVEEFTSVFQGSPIEMLQPTNFMHFILAIGFLVGGLMISSQIGGIGANWGANTVKGLGSKAGGVAKGGMMGIGRVAKDLTFTAGRKLDTAQMKLQKKLFGGEGKDYFAKSLNYTQIKKGWDASRAEALGKYEMGEETGTPPSATWHDVINKYVSLDQYKAIKKSPKQIAADRAMASKLEFDAGRSEERIKNTGLKEEEKDLIRDKYKKDKASMINNYVKNAPEELKTDEEKKKYAGDQYGYDWMSLDEPHKLDKTIDEKIKKENREKAEILNDPRISFLGVKMGSKKAADKSSVGYKYSKLGAEDKFDSALSEIRRQTGDDSGAIVEEILKSLTKGETSRVVGGLRLLTQNNDMNEALKDKRVINLMTKNNGLLEKLARSQNKDGKELISGLNMETVEAVKEDFRANPVTAANAQAMMQAMFKDLGLNDSMSAKIASGIGEIGIQKGNTLTYAMAKADEVNGGHTFEEMSYKNGKLHTSEGRRAAGVGKLNTFEAQAWARNIHPNAWFAEDPNGLASYLTDEGEAILRGFTSHNLAQINRLRADNFKGARSPKVMRQIRELADKVEFAEGDKKQAELIRYFGGFIKTKLKGGGIKDMDETIKEFNENN